MKRRDVLAALGAFPFLPAFLKPGQKKAEEKPTDINYMECRHTFVLNDCAFVAPFPWEGKNPLFRQDIPVILVSRKRLIPNWNQNHAASTLEKFMSTIILVPNQGTLEVHKSRYEEWTLSVGALGREMLRAFDASLPLIKTISWSRRDAVAWHERDPKEPWKATLVV
jgi:hypothetical protein